MLGLAMFALGSFQAARGRIGHATFGRVEGPQAVGGGIAMALVGAYGVLLSLRQALGRTWCQSRLVLIMAGSMGATGALALILHVVDARSSSMATGFAASMLLLLTIGFAVQRQLDRLASSQESHPDRKEGP
jgi:hypothetical protein